jgi:L-threonylcarbamoyladenylate synthase
MPDFEDDIKQAVLVLQQGGTILYPTDTVWGLGCDALNEAAVEKVFTIKHRPTNKSMIVLLAEEKDILQYVASPHPDIIDIVQNFDRPTTVIYDDALGFPYNVTHENGSLGIRVSTDAFCKGLIKRLKKPIISTSANISGKDAPGNFSEIDAEILKNVDFIVKYRQNDFNKAAASRIVRINDAGELELIRP